MKKTLGVLALLLATSLPLWAQGSNFAGYSVGITRDLERGSVEASDGSSGDGSTRGLGLQIQYAWAISQQFVLGTGVTFLSDNRSAGRYVTRSEAYTRDRYALDVLLGLAPNKSFLIYGKWSALGGSAGSSDGITAASVQGVARGVGVRAMVEKNIFLQAGYDYYKFSDVAFSNGTTASLRGSVMSVGLGYLF